MSAQVAAPPAPATQESPFDARRLRDAFGHFATGVAIVTARGSDGQRLGMTINSLASLSLQPALLLWSIACSSRSHDRFAGEVGHFAIHVLGEHQRALSRQFQQSAQERFAGLAVVDNAHGVPLLSGCLVRFECATDRIVPAGDHSIVIGRVQHIQEHPGEPLLFHRGRFGHFQDAS
ncbi:flavin reductase family protein [Pseudoxanthomonas winnipegensis]|uniref:flavin reductase family protein n=1 Tax=Pseudoxanthomonas winnipegensis TaxID=2480810 RepID=UPI00103B7102|nr:flavin reductase family protein [Pseudoxanthomonas winnipegensis]TBV72423.1 flavin reductase [Pseudoxanthomonas winnipegensis]